MHGPRSVMEAGRASAKCRLRIFPFRTTAIRNPRAALLPLQMYGQKYVGEFKSDRLGICCRSLNLLVKFGTILFSVEIFRDYYSSSSYALFLPSSQPFPPAPDICIRIAVYAIDFFFLPSYARLLRCKILKKL